MASNGVVLLIGLTAVVANPAFSQMDRITGKSFVTRSEVIAKNGMAATAQPLATEVAIDVLKKGGSAVDAAIAANATLGLMEPVNCGAGGDLFAIVWDAKSQKLYGLNGSGRSPKGLSYDQMKAELAKRGLKAIPKFGLLSISVPGAVDAWFELHNRFGKLPIQDDLAPAIQYATEGFPVTEYIAYLWQRNLAILGQEPGGLLQTYTINGAAPKKGDVFKNPDLANTYRIIAEKGRDAFYNGPIADKIDAFFRANGGFLRKEDFSSHHSDWVDLVTTNYRAYDVYELPPNTQGGTVLEMLNILEGFDLKAMEFGKPDTLHVMIEAKKLAFEDRAKMYADPAFYPPPMTRLLSKDYAAERRKLIDMKKAALHYDAGDAKLAQGDTTYLCVADKEGNMVSLIQSNFRGMGSGVVVPGLGFGFQDRGELFSMDPAHPNVYAPGKRPFHTIIPGFVMKDGKPWLAFGVMGGDMQPMGHVQVLTNLIDFGMNLQEAGDAARWQHEGSSEPTGETMTDGGWVNFESGYPYETIRELMNRGHHIHFDLGGYGGYQAIMRADRQGVYYGASESRKDGCAIGY
ncbi:MAG: gamma-glutamyltransferase [Verrucomicrobia bacterium]|nr:gamma-glutamyltransferase [Verrucomicrobiota bacterium]